jgi:hypothetical protein
MQLVDNPEQVANAIFEYYENRSFEPSTEEQQKLLEL